MEAALWFWLALGGALFQVLRNMTMKTLGHALDERINVWGRMVFILPFAGAAVWWRGAPLVGEGFWLLTALFGLSQTAATLALSKALHIGQISLVTALWKLSVLVLLVWNLLAGDPIGWLGGLGAAVSVLGMYLLNLEQARISWWAPLAAIWREAGQRWTVLAALGYACSVVLIKQMALRSDAFYAVLMGYVACALWISPYAFYASTAQFRKAPRYWKQFVALGLFGALSTWCGTTAYTLTASAYVEAVKQVEVLLAMAIGWLFFQEKARVKAIWPGVAVLLAGLLLVKLGT